jgi:preprotein translocase subunit SecG
MAHDNRFLVELLELLERGPDALLVADRRIVQGEIRGQRPVAALLKLRDQVVPAGRPVPGPMDEAEGGHLAARSITIQRGSSTLAPMATVLSVIEVIFSVVLIFLVLLHSGKDAGLSGAFGIGGGGSSFGGGSLVERNLTRWTIFFGVLWALNAIVIVNL